jgi:hypothetical protein
MQECKEGESLSGENVLPQKEQIKFKTFLFLCVVLQLQMGRETGASFMEFRMNADVQKHEKFLSINSVFY